MDLRNYDGTINIQPTIVNPDSKELIVTQHEFNHECQVFIYTASNPWVVFYILNVYPEK